jgi:hypothetical protein
MEREAAEGIGPAKDKVYGKIEERSSNIIYY